MTDSDSDTSNNVFTFPNGNTTVSAKGPNTNITNLSFRNQLTSTMCMPRNFERQRYAESAFDQRSMYYRRETSPMSIHSASDVRPRNYQQYYSGMNSQQSLFNGRSGSPMSMRSIDSSASVSAADIAFAFKNVKYNKYDLKVIKDAYHKLMKQRVRKRIEKRRNMRLFLKGSRRRSGYDSGEQGSNSSISSDDCRSIKTSYKENMSSSRSARIDLTDYRKSYIDTMPRDWSDNFRQNTFKNKFSVGSGSVNNTQNINNIVMSKQSNPMSSLKDRFRNGFLLPSQRFNKSVASSVIPETTDNHKNIDKTAMRHVKNKYAQSKQNSASESDEEIFSEVSTVTTANAELHRKRGFESEDNESYPKKKKSKISSPTKHPQTNIRAPSILKNVNPPNNNSIEMTNNFEFIKPSVPVRKSKPRAQEKLIAKSSQPLTDFLEPVPNNKIQNDVQSNEPSNFQEKSSENLTQLDQSQSTQISDVSTRPSFIKRKLFTQKLDVAEKATDGKNSPQGSVYSLQKEKNKARKLVTNHSCLNREVQDDNNLLDLIHKIVPPDRMNITNQTTVNQTKTNVNIKDKQSNDNKWDVTSVLSMCNDDDESITYTDEEIFEEVTTKKDTNKDKAINTKAESKTTNSTVNSIQIHQDCKVVLEKLHKNSDVQKLNLTHNNITGSNTKCPAGKSFWDTDSESDAEWSTTLSQRNAIENIKKANAMLEASKENVKNSSGGDHILKQSLDGSKQVSKQLQKAPDVLKQFNNTKINNTLMNNTIDSMRKFNTSTLSIRSHRTSKKKKSHNETCTTEIKSNLLSQNKIIIDHKKENSTNQSKTSSDTQKLKLNKQNEIFSNPLRSSSQSKKSPKDKKSNVGKPDESSKKSNCKPEPKSKPAKLNNTVNKLKSSKSHNNSSAKKNTPENKIERKQVKTIAKSNTKSVDQNNKKDKKSPKKPKSNLDHESSTSVRSKQNNSVLQPAKSVLNNTVDTSQKPKNDRPVRSCRTLSQSRLELSKSSQFNNTSDSTKSLRSRVIDLSSSIDNITIKIKPSNKTIKNKNITIIQTRKSDVSFTLGSGKHTPTPKKHSARSRADFFKGKRKT